MIISLQGLIEAARRSFADEPMPLAACLRIRELAANASDYEGHLLPDCATYLSNGEELDDEFLASALAGEELGGWALAAPSLSLLARSIRSERPNSVLEFGSGRSTVALAHFMRALHPERTGPLVISIEQSQEYLEETRALLERANLADRVRLVHAPLRLQLFGSHQSTCYDLTALLSEGILQSAAPGLVVVDGPFGGYGVRFGTVPIVHEAIAENAVILMDDALRDSELAIAKWWEELGFVAPGGVLWSGKGTYITRKRRAPLRQGPAAAPESRRRLFDQVITRHHQVCAGSGNFGLPLPFSWASDAAVLPTGRPASRISIVIPMFNRAVYIEQALQSALSQDGIFEVVVVDDGSTDGSVGLVQRNGDSRLRLIQKPHSGGPATRNRGIAEAKGDFILWLDSDDYLAPGTVPAYLSAIEQNPEVDIFYGDLVAFDGEGLTTQIRYPNYGRHPNIRGLLLRGNVLPNPGTLVRRRLYDRIGGYDEAFRRAHDYEFWSRAAGQANFRHVGRVVCHWRLHDAPSLSGDCASVDRSFEAQVVKNLVSRTPLRELVPDLAWTESPAGAEAAANKLVADVLLALRDLEGAREALLRAVASSPGDDLIASTSRAVEAASRVADGERAYLGDDFDYAELEFTAALALDPESVDAHNNLGAIALRRSDALCALGWFVRALKLNGLSREAVLNCTRLLASMDRAEDAVAICEHYLAHAPLDRGVRAALREIRNECPSAKDSRGTNSLSLTQGVEEPLVSVIVPTKDRPRLLVDALRSLISQSYQRWEATVVNDGGSEVDELVSSLDPLGRIHCVKHPQTRGQAAARNTGINLSRGEILCYLDDDDLMLPSHLETVVTALEETGAEVVYTEAEYVAETLSGEERVEHSRSRRYSGISYSQARLHVANFIPINTVAHRRRLLSSTGAFDTSLTALEDWDLLLRFARKTDLHHIAHPTVEVRTRASAEGDHVSVRQREQFPAVFRQIYARYPVDFEPRLEAERQLQLSILDTERQNVSATEGYRRWVERSSLKESDAQYMAERMMLEWRSQPLFHLLVLHESGEDEALAETLDALARQLYKGWGLSVISAAEAPEEIAGVTNVEWLKVEDEGRYAANAVAQQSTADWVLLLEAGATLAPEALFSVADYSHKYPDWQVIYADEDRVSVDGERHDPRFKPDFNLDLLRSTPYMGPFVAIRRELLVRVGGYRPFSEATVYDLVLRALEAVGERSVGHIAKVLFHRSDRFARTRDEALEAKFCREAVKAHLERVGVDATVRPGVLPRTQDIDYAFEGSPRVCVIVPTKDQAVLLRACVESVLSITSYPNFEVLVVDNGSTERAAIDYLNEVPARDRRVRVLRYDRPYSFSAINNFAVEHATGELICLLNNDTQVLHEDWMTRMVGHAMRPEVGAVGARLLFPDGTIQHGGVVMGMTTTADHPEIGTPMGEPGYMGRLQVTQNYSAVTAACLMIKRDLFNQVGGMDEENFKVLFNDVDLCLKLREAGYKNVWTPHATLVHHASVSLKAANDAAALERARGERESLQRKWGKALACDPAFNRNLSLLSQKVRVESVLNPGWDPNFRDRPRIVASALDPEGTGHYRVWGPLQALDRATIAQSALLPPHGHGGTGVRVPTVAELERMAPDTLLIQQGYYDIFLEWLEQYRKYSNVFLAFGQDDNVLNVPKKNPLGGRLVADLERRIARALACCDRLIVTTEPLVDVYRKYIGDVRVVPNALDESRWTGLESKRRGGGLPRVGWAGALQHLGDLEWLEPVVEALSKEVDWVFMGMCPKNLKPYVREFHRAVGFDKYPEKLASLDLDLALAPLEMHVFNEAKSDLRILEYGVLGWPVIATDIYPYQGRPVTCIPNDPARWISAIRERVNDLDALAAEGDRLREWVLAHRMLRDNLDAWVRALFSDEVLREFGVIRSLAA